MVRKEWIAVGALILAMLLVSVALAAGSPRIDRWLIGGGGGSTTLGDKSMDSTLGQWVVGSDKSGSLQLASGFWGGGWDEAERYVTYLPVALRDFP